MCAKGESIQAFELVVDSLGPPKSLQVSILRISGAPSESDVIVHLLQPLDREGRLGRELERLGLASLPAGTPKPPDGKSTSVPLTTRERDVLGLVAEGLQNKEIADRLDISLATVRNHVHNLLEKLGVHSKLEAISLAYREGWVLGPRESRSGRTDRARRSLD
jgi:DNA-binding NarL/FixJ family response regulator